VGYPVKSHHRSVGCSAFILDFHSSTRQSSNMSESISIGDPTFILHRAIAHMKDQGKDVDDDAVFTLQNAAVSFAILSGLTSDRG